MRYLKYLLLLAVLVLPAVHSQAQVAIGVQIGPNYGLYNAPPVCEYGFYPDYPFGCAPYGYWGPEWFVDGAFIGAGPWYNFYYVHPRYWSGSFISFYRGGKFHEFGGFRDNGFRGFDRGFRGNEGFRGGDRGFRGNEGFRGGDRGARGDQGFRGGDRGFRGGDRGSQGGNNNRGNEGSRGGDHGGSRASSGGIGHGAGSGQRGGDRGQGGGERSHDGGGRGR